MFLSILYAGLLLVERNPITPLGILQSGVSCPYLLHLVHRTCLPPALPLHSDLTCPLFPQLKHSLVTLCTGFTGPGFIIGRFRSFPVAISLLCAIKNHSACSAISSKLSNAFSFRYTDRSLEHFLTNCSLTIKLYRPSNSLST